MKTVKSIAQQHKDDLVVLLGNGVNRHYHQNNCISWDQLLRDIESHVGLDEFMNDPKDPNVSLIELAELSNKPLTNIKSFIMDKFSAKGAIKSMKFIEDLNRLNIPILTTNFDKNIELSLKLKKFITPHSIKGNGFTPKYPWNLYYANNKLESPLSGFGVWHIHGTIDYKDSICISLNDYVNLITKARKMIGYATSIFSLPFFNIEEWKSHNNWLNLFFNKSVLIIGLSLSQKELFIRWLLIVRSRYYTVHPGKKKPAWFVYREEDGLSAYDQYFFKNVGIEFLSAPNYDDIYNL